MSLRGENKGQSGSASIEASVALVFFVFAIWAIYALADFCIVQAKVSYAIDTAAKEMSQYSYFYYKLGAQSAVEGLDEKSKLAVSSYENLGKLLNMADHEAADVSDTTEDPFSSVVGAEDVEDWNEVYARIQAVSEDVAGVVDNPLQYMESVAALAGKNIAGQASHVVGASLAKGMVQRHFGETRAEANEFLERYGVQGGYDGLNFGMSSIFADGSEKIEIVVYYKMDIENVVPFFDKEIVVCQKAVTDGWLGGDAA